MTTLSKNFVPYTLALKLKELGFDEECIAAYFSPDLRFIDEFSSVFLEKNSKFCVEDKYCAAPLWQQAFEWMREKYNLHPHICYFENTNSWHWDIYHLEKGLKTPPELKHHKTYEEAQEQCLTKLIEIVQDGTQNNK